MLEISNIRDNVDLVKSGSKEFYLVGTAHVSKSSMELAEEIIREVKPNSVAVELCEHRHSSLKDPNRWKNMDIVSVIREGKTYVLLAQLMLAGFQKKLGEKLQIKPGAEMLRSLEVAKEVGCQTVLADREIKTTLKRTWSSLGIWGTCKLIFGMLAGAFGEQNVTEEEIERLKSADALDELMKEFSKALPGVRKALIDERDKYLAAKIASAPGEKIVAIVGAGHIPGIKEWLDKDVDLKELEEIPPAKKITKVIAWGIPILVISLIVFGFFKAGIKTSISMLESWFWINAAFGALGSLIALAHPVTIFV
ncbi:MAG: TraB/GumN family protein, partial [Bdellovibrionales bacterium]|nr:TraB/GumN family protein [Bdellovibrionales bacterium]